jgi:hypothetical protein
MFFLPSKTSGASLVLRPILAERRIGKLHFFSRRNKFNSPASTTFSYLFRDHDFARVLRNVPTDPVTAIP